MKKSFIKVAGLLAAVSMFAPLMVRAAEPTVQEHSILVPLLQPADGRGDANAIGKFNSNSTNRVLVLVVGKVTAVSPTSLSVNRTSAAGVVTNYTFTIDTSTAIIRKFKSTSDISEVSVGDQVQVWATKANGIAKLIWDKSIWRVGQLGVISDLNSTLKTFKITVSRTDKETGDNITYTIKVKTGTFTTYWLGTAAKTFNDLSNGGTIYLRGVWDSPLKIIWAKNIGIIPTS